MEKKLIGYLSLFLVLIVLLFQAWYPAWFRHISVDIYVYYSRASYFLEHFNLTGLNYNEHMPGAILLFMSVIPALLINNSFFSYTWGFIIVNVLLVLLIAYIYIKVRGEYNLVVYALILLFTGPILFFRFDLLAIWLVIISFYFWNKKQLKLAAIFLGMATLVKIYPVIFVPYLLLISYKNKSWSGVFNIGLTFLLTVYFLLGFYILIFQVPLQNIIFSLDFHAMKPVHTESIWADLLMLPALFATGHLPTLVGEWGINGLAPQYWIMPLWFYNYVWILPIGLVYLWLFNKRNKLNSIFDVQICFVIVLLFLIFSKVLSHQYLLWFFLLIPLLKIKTLLSRYWIINLFLVLLTSFLYQYIYPLNYTQFLNAYSHPNDSIYLFAVLIISHLFLIILLFRLISELRKTYK